MRRRQTEKQQHTAKVIPLHVNYGSDRKTPGQRDFDLHIAEDERDRILRRLTKELVDKLNKKVQLKGYKLPVFEMDDSFGSVAEWTYADQVVAAARRGPEHLNKARFYLGRDSTIDMVLETVDALVNGRKEKPHVAVRLPTQAGKTLVQTMAACIYKLVARSMGRQVHVVFVPYGRRGPSKDALNALNGTLNVAANLRVRGFSRTLWGVNNVEGKDKAYRRNVKDIDEVVRTARLAGMDEILIAMDEADWAAGDKSQLDQVLEKYAANPRAMGEIRVHFMLTSATGECYMDLDCVTLVERDFKPGSGYRGLCQGDYLHIHGLSEVAEQAALGPALNNFLIRKDAIEKVGSVCDLVERLARGMLAPKLGLNGLPLNGGSCIVIRYGSSGQTESLEYKLKKNYAERLGLEVLSFYGEGLADKNGGPRLVEEAIAGKKRCVLLLKGAGRRSDVFPDACSIFLDFTTKTVTAEALSQGMIGRASGFKPDNIFVMVSDANMETVTKTRERFEETGDDRPVIKSGRAVRVDRNGRKARVRRKGGPKKTEQFKIADLPPEIRDPLATNLMKMVAPYLTLVERTVKNVKQKVVRLRKHEPGEKLPKHVLLAEDNTLFFNFYHLLGGKKNVARLEREFGAKLLMPGVERKLDGKMMNGNPDVEIAVGNIGRSGAQGAQDGSNRRGKGTGVAQRGGLVRLAPDILFSFRKAKKGEEGVLGYGKRYVWTPQQMLLQLDTNAVEGAAAASANRARAAKYKPNEKTTWKRWRSEDEQEQAQAEGF